MNLYQYLLDNYEENEPIILSDLKIDGMTSANVRQQVKKLKETGKIRCFNQGIYFLPKKTIFKSGSQLSLDKVIEYKYLKDGDKLCGYISGLLFCNQLGLTSQVPMVYEVVTNKATTAYREVMIGKTRVIIRKPKAEITERNYRIMQFLDLIKDIDVYSETDVKEQQERLYSYMSKYRLKLKDIQQYYSYYPDKLYKNLVETGVIYYGVSAQQ